MPAAARVRSPAAAAAGAPAWCGNAQRLAQRDGRRGLVFTHATDHRYDARAWVPCSYSGTATRSPWTFTAQLYPGTYTVVVSPYASPPLPTWNTTASTTFSALVSGAQFGVVFDVPIPPQSRSPGASPSTARRRARRRGAATPSGSPNAMDAAELVFTHATNHRYDARAWVPCSYSTSTG